MRKRQSPKRKVSKKKEQAPKPTVEILPIEYETQAIEETANVLFKPNKGPQTDFLAAAEREVLYGGSAGGGKSYAMLADHYATWGILHSVDCYCDIQQKN